MQGDAADRKEGITGVDGLRDTVAHPQGGATTPFGVTILNVVMNEREVVPELDRGSSGECAIPVWREGGVGQEAEEGAHALSGAGGRIGISKVIPNLFIHGCCDWLLPRSEQIKDGSVGRRDELVEIQAEQVAAHLLLLIAHTPPFALWPARLSAARL